MSKKYLVNNNGNIIRLEKEMRMEEVLDLLGNPTSNNNGAGTANQKLIYSFNNGRGAMIDYSILFTNDLLVYAARLSAKS